jgi:cell division septation protein DedD
MMGRPSGKQLTAIPETSPTAEVASAPAQSQESEPPRETAPPDTQPPPPTETTGTSTPSATQTQAARDLPDVPAAPAPAPPSAPATAVPETGATYLQVTALRRTDADNLVKTLKEQNFPAILADSSKSDLFRVLVGPYHQTADVADAKARLKALGFANAFVQK